MPLENFKTSPHTLRWLFSQQNETFSSTLERLVEESGGDGGGGGSLTRPAHGMPPPQRPLSVASNTHRGASKSGVSSNGSGLKRKSSQQGKGSGSGNGGDDDDDRSQSEPQPKKKRPERNEMFDCPVSRGTLHNGRQSRGCPSNGMKFWDVWRHLQGSHFGCEKCGTKFQSTNAAMLHDNTAKDNPGTCLLKTGLPTYEIGVPTMAKLNDITGDRKSSHRTRWIRWWRELYPGTPDPNPLHSPAITLSSADFPAVQEAILDRWADTPSLPNLSEGQREQLASIIGDILGDLPRVIRQRTTPTGEATTDEPPPEPLAFIAAAADVEAAASQLSQDMGVPDNPSYQGQDQNQVGETMSFEDVFSESLEDLSVYSNSLLSGVDDFGLGDGGHGFLS